MKKKGHYGLTTLVVICCLVFMGYPILADDTCVFSVTADDLPPNIVLLPDSGADTEQVDDQYTSVRDRIPSHKDRFQYNMEILCLDKPDTCNGSALGYNGLPCTGEKDFLDNTGTRCIYDCCYYLIPFICP